MHVAKAPFAFAQAFLRPLSIRQIDDEGDDAGAGLHQTSPPPPAPARDCRLSENTPSRTVWTVPLGSPLRHGPARRRSCHSAGVSQGGPTDRPEMGPADISNDLEKRLVGLHDVAV